MLFLIKKKKKKIRVRQFIHFVKICWHKKMLAPKVIFRRLNEKKNFFIYIFGNKTTLGTIWELLVSLTTSLIFSTPYA